MKVLFVCTGNSCRSPMAELYFNDLVRKAGSRDLQGFSAGIYAGDGFPISRSAAAVMAELGIGSAEFASSAFTPKRAEEYDLLIGMTRTHAALMRHIAPDCAGKVRTLLPEGDVPDPFGGSVDEYKKVFSTMKSALDDLFNELENKSK